MKITRISVFQVDLPLEHPYWLSGGRLKFEVLDATQPFGRGRKQSVPECFSADATWADDTDACNRYPTLGAHRFDITSS